MKGIDDISSCQEPNDDPLPEQCHYRDEGCELSSSCLDCPLPRCIYEEPGGRQQRLRRQRDEEIRRLFQREERDAQRLAQRFGVSKRTVYRIVRRGSR
jgi:hypothetical protein